MKENHYDIYIFDSYIIEGISNDINKHLIEHKNPLLNKKIFNKGFLGITIDISEVEKIMNDLKNLNINAIAIPKYYNNPQISLKDALSIVKLIIKEEIENIDTEHPCYWRFTYSFIDNKIDEEPVPSHGFICIDKHDAHQWTKKDFYSIRNNIYYKDSIRNFLERYSDEYDVYVIPIIDKGVIDSLLNNEKTIIPSFFVKKEKNIQGFLGITVSFFDACTIRENLLKTYRKIDIWVVHISYRHPLISNQQAFAIAENYINRKKEQNPSIAFGTLKWVDTPRDIMWFRYQCPSHEKNKQKMVYVYVDRIDGHY